MQISTLLANKGTFVATVPGDAAVTQALVLLRRHGIGALVVAGDGEHIDGVVSERDVVRALADVGDDVLTRPVSSIMTTEVTTCAPDGDVESLMATMTNLRIRHVPVIDAGRLCGIVSIGDVVKTRIEELERNRQELVDYIHAR